MAALPSEDLLKIWRGLMRFWSASLTEIGLSKTELYDAAVDTDQWIDDNQAAFNAALSTAAQSGLTTAQKTALFCTVAIARLNPELLRNILGEIN